MLGVGGACCTAVLRVGDEEVDREDMVRVGDAESAREAVEVGCTAGNVPGEERYPVDVAFGFLFGFLVDTIEDLR